VILNTALRIGDLLRLRWRDVYDLKKLEPKYSLHLTEKKTGKQKTVALNDNIKYALRLNCDNTLRPDTPLFPGTWDKSSPISRIRAYMIIRAAGNHLGMNISCHSLRKTFGYHAWKNDAPLAVIMSIYNHSSVALTLRYLGITQDDQNKVYNDIAKILPID
jgi:integrase